MRSRTLLAIFSITSLALTFYAAASSADDLASGFRNVPSESRMRMYWRVFGPAWTEREVDRQLALMKEAGLGGVTIYFLYPVAVDNPGAGIINKRFGSQEFLRTFAYAARRAEELGLSLSVNDGTGWAFGGPAVAPRDMALRLREVLGAKDAAAGDFVRLGANETIIAAFLGDRDVTDTVRSGRLPMPLPDELRALGILFNPPLEAEVTTALRSGVNVLEIIVANLPLNRFLGLPDQDLGPLRARFGSRFPSPEEKKTPNIPAPSGLIGKVHLVVYR
jgi:hypothetical protein